MVCIRFGDFLFVFYIRNLEVLLSQDRFSDLFFFKFATIFLVTILEIYYTTFNFAAIISCFAIVIICSYCYVIVVIVAAIAVAFMLPLLLLFAFLLRNSCYCCYPLLTNLFLYF
ncbi:hypothetical protein LguiA_002819 [Lonicera macranthoides]